MSQWSWAVGLGLIVAMRREGKGCEELRGKCGGVRWGGVGVGGGAGWSAEQDQLAQDELLLEQQQAVGVARRLILLRLDGVGGVGVDRRAEDGAGQRQDNQGELQTE